MEDAHNFHEGAAKAGEFGDKKGIALLHFPDERAKFSVSQAPGRGNGFLNPAVNVEFLLRSVFEEFVPLVLSGLFVG